MEKLIITTCAADSRKHPGVPTRLQTPEAVAAEIRGSYEAGADIAPSGSVTSKVKLFSRLSGNSGFGEGGGV